MTERELFVAALAIEPPDDRGAYLDAACAGRPDLRCRLDALLRAHAESGRFLQDGVVAPMSCAAVVTPMSENSSATPFPGSGPSETDLASGMIVGRRYRLLDDIGAGGMGRVWSAEQTHPVHRIVAIKLIKAGMDTRQVLARFDAERQALALMDHPNIAKVFDGGMTEAGRPYFVMELVRGSPITDYCQHHGLDIAARLRLFLPVCQAVQHAHQKGIIHRDLKPSNILVVERDGLPTPKIIDFGLAKAMGAPHLLTEQSFFTAAGTIVGTPIYMAPEQTQPGSFGADTRTDVFTLGVILYELLAGRTPLDKEQLREASWDEICRLIREFEPARPSAVDPDVPRDLDWIALTAMEKDCARRYSSASALADDLQRFLDDEPVQGRPPSELYRIGKFVRRHRGPMIAAGLIVLALVTGLAGTLWALAQARTAAEAERDANNLAQQRLTQVESANDILETLFLTLDPHSGKLDGQTMTEVMTDRVRQAAARLDEAAIDDPATVARLQNSIGAAEIGLGNPRSAVRYLTRADRTMSAIHGPRDRRTLMCRNNLARALDDAGRVQEALDLFRETQAAMAAHLGPDDAATLLASTNLGMAYLRAFRFDDALPLLRHAYESQNARLGPEAMPVQASATALASAYEGLQQFQRSLDLLEPVYEKRLAAMGGEHPRTIVVLDAMAKSYRGLGQKAKAISCLERAWAGRKSVNGIDHAETLKCAAHLASTYKDAGQLDKALALYEQTLPKLREKLGPDHPETMTCLNNFAMANWIGGHLEISIPLFEELVDLINRKLGPDHPNAIKAMANLGVNYRDVQRFDEAVARLSEARDRIKKLPLSVQVPQNFIPCALADTLDRQRAYEKSVPVHREAADLTRRRDGDDHGNTRVEVARLAAALLCTGRYSEAEPILRDCLERSERVDPDHWLTYCVRAMLGASLAGQGKFAEAEPLMAAGYAGLRDRQEKIAPKFRKLWFTMVLESLTAIHESAGRGDDAARWRAELQAW